MKVQITSAGLEYLESLVKSMPEVSTSSRVEYNILFDLANSPASVKVSTFLSPRDTAVGRVLRNYELEPLYAKALQKLIAIRYVEVV